MHVFERPRFMLPLLAGLAVLVSGVATPVQEPEIPPALARLAAVPEGDAILTTSPGGRVRIGDEVFSIQALDFDVGGKDGEGGFRLIGVFDDDRGRVSLALEEDEPSGPVELLQGFTRREVQDPEFFPLDGEDAVGVVGLVAGAEGRMQEFAAVLAFGAGSSTFRLEGELAFLNGELGSGTYRQVEYLIEHCPEVGIVVFEEVPGSVNDEVNVETGRLIREAGFTTVLVEGGMIASGGVDLFCAGEVRADAGGRIGVHSWGDPGGDIDPNALPRSHPAHHHMTRYFRQMLADGEEFYFFTLAAAPFDDIHWMTAAEIDQYGLVNVDVEDLGLALEALDPRDRSEGRDDEDGSPDDTHVGGCILRTALGTVPENPYEVTDVLPTANHAPFTKKLTACGVILVAADDVEDEFLQLVGRAAGEMFRDREGVDRDLQRQVIEHLHRYRAMLPVPRTERSLDRLLGSSGDAASRLFDENSVCDIIMAQVPRGQVMEVVEHLLHAVTDVGLHYQFPDEWGISRESALWQAMQQAIDGGHYEIESYQDMAAEAPREVYDRVLMQEFAYWFISTAWNLQEPYGPGEDEWTVANREQLEEVLPEFFDVYRRTAERVLSAPNRSTLQEIGPTRDEEGR